MHWRTVKKVALSTSYHPPSKKKNPMTSGLNHHMISHVINHFTHALSSQRNFAVASRKASSSAAVRQLSSFISTNIKDSPSAIGSSRCLVVLWMLPQHVVVFGGPNNTPKILFVSIGFFHFHSNRFQHQRFEQKESKTRIILRPPSLDPLLVHGFFLDDFQQEAQDRLLLQRGAGQEISN